MCVDDASRRYEECELRRKCSLFESSQDEEQSMKDQRPAGVESQRGNDVDRRGWLTMLVDDVG